MLNAESFIIMNESEYLDSDNSSDSAEGDVIWPPIVLVPSIVILIWVFVGAAGFWILVKLLHRRAMKKLRSQDVEASRSTSGTEGNRIRNRNNDAIPLKEISKFHSTPNTAELSSSVAKSLQNQNTYGSASKSSPCMASTSRYSEDSLSLNENENGSLVPVNVHRDMHGKSR